MKEVQNNLEMNIMDENVPMFLVEFHGDRITAPAYKEDGKEIDMQGLKIYRIIDRDSQILAKYDQIKDDIDTSALAVPNAIIVFVASEDGKELHWYKTPVMAWNNNKREYIIGRKLRCSDAEVEYLDKNYPEYFSHCTLE